MSGMMHTSILRRTLAPFTLIGLLALVAVLPAGRASGNTSAAQGSVTAAAVAPMARLDAAGGLSGEFFGSAIALDGDLLAVGAHYADVNGVRDAGTVYLYARDTAVPAGWIEIKKLNADKLEVGAGFGESVALHGDVLAVGAPNENNFGSSENGVAYVFERDRGGANAWGLAKKLPGTAGSFGRFGSAVALGGDTLVVGAQNAKGTTVKGGAAYLFSRAAGWSEIQRVSNVDGAIGDLFGTSVALDGDTLVVGAEQADFTFVDGNQGAAFVYQRNAGGIWVLFGRLVADAPAKDSDFGADVAIDGDTIVVGAPESPTGGTSPINDVGAAFVFERNQGGANAWGLSRRLDPGGGALGDNFGVAVAVQGDQVLAGADFAGESGYVFRFERDVGGANNWGPGRAPGAARPAVGRGLRQRRGTQWCDHGGRRAQSRCLARRGLLSRPGSCHPPVRVTQIYLPLSADEALARPASSGRRRGQGGERRDHRRGGRRDPGACRGHHRRDDGADADARHDRQARSAIITSPAPRSW